MVTLGIAEEIKILESLIGAQEIDYGSSRIVFDLPGKRAAEIGLDTSRDYVIKLAVGTGGLHQNALELDTFLNYRDLPLAEIAATGRYINIMEKVSEQDFYDFADAELDPTDYVEGRVFYTGISSDEKAKLRDRDIKEYAAADKVISKLEEVFGRTSDNGQLGWTSKGKLVAYDYGFEIYRGRDYYCSDDRIWDFYWNDQEYIRTLIKLLRSESQTLEEWEEAFIRQDEQETQDGEDSQNSLDNQPKNTYIIAY